MRNTRTTDRCGHFFANWRIGNRADNTCNAVFALHRPDGLMPESELCMIVFKGVSGVNEMKIIEEFIKGKRPRQSECEDGYVIKPQFVAVIDGVTSKGKHLWESKYQSGCYATRKVKEFLSGDVEKLTAEELFSSLSRYLMEAYKRELGEDVVEERLRACIIVYNGIYKEIWSYGDCQCMLDGKVYKDDKEIDNIFAKKRSDIIKKALEDGMKEEELIVNDVGRKAILEDIKEQFSYENKMCELGYPVLNGDDIIPEMIKKLSVSEAAEVVLASDGYPILCDTLEKSEKELKRLLEEDPLCIGENMGTKGVQPELDSFDDRCYVRFVI